MQDALSSLYASLSRIQDATTRDVLRQHADAIASTINQSKAFQSIPPPKQLTLAQIKAALQASGTSPLVLTGLPGQAPAAQFGTHASRPAAANVPLGGFYVETDRTVLYVNETVANINTWVYVAGAYYAAFASRPADLGTNDFGFLFYATDRHILYYWDGAAWQIIFTPLFEGAHATRLTSTFYPWKYATGTQFWETDRTVTYLTADSTGTVTTVGTAVAWVSGNKFDVNWGTAPQPTITINGVSYAIASVASNIALTLATTAGNQVGVAYTVTSGKWIYESGTCNTVQASLPADLAVNDFGFLENVTDYSHVLQWDGAAWRFGPGDAGGGFIQGFAQTPANANGWVACAGQGAGAVKYLKSDGTLGNAPALPAAAGGYVKFAAAYSAPRAASQTDDTALTVLLTTSLIPVGDGSSGSASVVTGAVISPDPHCHLLANPQSAGGDVDLVGADLIPYFRV